MNKSLLIIFIFYLSVCSKPLKTISYEYNNKDTIVVETTISKNGIKNIERLLHGKLNGKCETYYADGEISQIENFINGKTTGITKGWLPDGTLSVYKPYHNGTPVDTHKVWYDNKNQESIIIYDSTGNKNGWCRNWYENGNLQDSTLYTHGTKLQEFLYYENGKPMLTSTLKEDGYITSAQSWFPTGKKNGEVKNGNGKVLTPRTGNLYFDTLVVKDGKVQSAAYEYFKDR